MQNQPINRIPGEFGTLNINVLKVMGLVMNNVHK